MKVDASFLLKAKFPLIRKEQFVLFGYGTNQGRKFEVQN